MFDIDDKNGSGMTNSVLSASVTEGIILLLDFACNAMQRFKVAFRCASRRIEFFWATFLD